MVLSLHAPLLRPLRQLQRIVGVLLVAACAGACMQLPDGGSIGAIHDVASIAPRIRNATYVPGAREFCRNNPRDCMAGPIVTLNPVQEDLALDISRGVNHALKWSPPQAGRGGRTNTWHVLQDGGEGPCTDFAATKLDRILDAGLPAGAFSFALVHVDGNPSSILHLVLVANFHDGLYVLDSRDDRLWRPQEIADYAWLSFQSFGEPALWRAGEPSAEPSVLVASADLRPTQDLGAPHLPIGTKAPVVLVASSHTPVHGVEKRVRSGRRRARVG